MAWRFIGRWEGRESPASADNEGNGSTWLLGKSIKVSWEALGAFCRVAEDGGSASAIVGSVMTFRMGWRTHFRLRRRHVPQAGKVLSMHFLRLLCQVQI